MEKAKELELTAAAAEVKVNEVSTEAENELLLDVACLVSNKEWQE